jgi:antitoxin PrlF
LAAAMASKVSIHGETVIPKPIRLALGIPTGGEVVFRIEDGRVTLTSAKTWHSDPALNAFVELLARDIKGDRNLRDLPSKLTTLMRLAIKLPASEREMPPGSSSKVQPGS